MQYIEGENSRRYSKPQASGFGRKRSQLASHVADALSEAQRTMASFIATIKPDKHHADSPRTSGKCLIRAPGENAARSGHYRKRRPDRELVEHTRHGDGHSALHVPLSRFGVKSWTAAATIFSFGAVLYEMLRRAAAVRGEECRGGDSPRS